MAEEEAIKDREREEEEAVKAKEERDAAIREKERAEEETEKARQREDEEAQKAEEAAVAEAAALEEEEEKYFAFGDDEDDNAELDEEPDAEPDEEPYASGDRVYVYSASQDIWYGDGKVIDTGERGVKVIYNRKKRGKKWIPADQISEFLRRWKKTSANKNKMRFQSRSHPWHRTKPQTLMAMGRHQSSRRH